MKKIFNFIKEQYKVHKAIKKITGGVKASELDTTTIPLTGSEFYISKAQYMELMLAQGVSEEDALFEWNSLDKVELDLF